MLPISYGQWVQVDSLPGAGLYDNVFYVGTAVYSDFLAYSVRPDGKIGVMDDGFAGGPKAETGVLTLGDWYYVGVTVSSGNAITFYYRHYNDSAFTVDTGTFQSPFASNLLVVGGDPDVVTFDGKTAYPRFWDVVLTEVEMLAESLSTIPIVTPYAAWAPDPVGSSTASGRALTPVGTLTDYAPPVLPNGPPVPCLLASNASTTNFTDTFATVSVTPHSGAVVVMDVVVTDNVATSAPDSVTGASITGAALVDVTNGSVEITPDADSRRISRFKATGTGTAGAITVGHPGSPTITGRIYMIRTYPAGTEFRQTVAPTGTGTALAATLAAAGTRPAVDAAWVTVATSGTSTVETGYMTLTSAALSYTTPQARMIFGWRGAADTSPTATHDVSGAWAGLVSEIGPATTVTVDGTTAFSVTAGITAAGRTVINGTAAFGVTATVATAGKPIVNGTATFAATAVLAATGTLAVNGAASLAASATLTAAGSQTVNGTAALATTVDLTAAGSRTATGTAQFATAVAVTAAGTTGVAGTATFAMTVELAAAGKPAVAGSAVFAASVAVSATGTQIRSGQAAFAVLVGIEGAGTRRVAAQAILGVNAGITAGGHVTRNGAVALAALVALAAAGHRTGYGTVTLATVVAITARGHATFDWDVSPPVGVARSSGTPTTRRGTAVLAASRGTAPATAGRQP